MENIIVTEELKAYIDPLTEDEYAALERSILAEGCRDALVLWGDILVDGHNRHSICTKHGLPFQTVQNTRFKSMEDVHLWMIDQHLGRRSVSDFQRGVLALRKKEIMEARRLAVLSDPSPEASAAEAERDALRAERDALAERSEAWAVSFAEKCDEVEAAKSIIRDCLKELDRSQRPSYAWQLRARSALTTKGGDHGR